MSQRPCRNHSPAIKAKVAIAAIKGERTIAQIAEQFDVHPNQVTMWKSLLEGGLPTSSMVAARRHQRPPPST